MPPRLRPVLCGLVALLPGSGARAQDAPPAAPTWSDGAPVVRFDQRDDAPVETAADWTGLIERRWAGPTIWTNRLEDWVVRNDNLGGWLSCEPARPLACRTAHLLTWELVDRAEPFRLEVVVRAPGGGGPDSFAGFLVGAGEGRLDYRGAALVQCAPGKGGGLLAVIETSGEGGLQFRDMSQPENAVTFSPLDGQQSVAKNEIRLDYHQMMLELEGVPRGDTYDLRLSLWARHSGDLLAALELRGVPAERLRGNVALASHGGPSNARHQFGYLRVGGGRLEPHPERTFGPVAGTLYAVSNRVLKLGVQFMHLGEAVLPPGQDDRRRNQPRMTARLEVRPKGEDAWQAVSYPHAIAPPDFYVLFRLDGWDSTRDWETRVLFEDELGAEHSYATLVRHDPTDMPRINVAGFTGMGAMGRVAHQVGEKPGEGEVVVGRWTPANVWVPFNHAVDALLKQDVDLLCFTGDQIYEGKPTWREPGREPDLDYLYKWLLWHWSFRPLTNHLPAVCQPDDHDVYHGNLWGWGGRLCLTNNVNDGGYVCSPTFVNLVHRTQTAHNPDAYDPVPADTGITHYYCTFTWGGIGFAVVEDRKFKSPPAVQDPAQQTLLGPTQLRCLDAWSADWTGQAAKCVVSQTNYSCQHVGFDGQLAKDPDSGGFPKVGRDRAVRIFQRCGAFLLTGDQHLGTFARLGLDRPSDAVYQFCVPAMANIFWRWFYPATPGQDRAAGEPDYLGEFTDPFGNFFRMVAVANPERQALLSQKLRQRSVIPVADFEQGKGDGERTCQGDGYGVVRFDKTARAVTVECWPQNADPAKDQQFPGWPQTLSFDDLDGRKPVAWLPDLAILGAPEAVVQTVEQSTGELVKVARAHEGRYRPGVFTPDGVYTLRVGEPGRTAWQELRDLRPGAVPGERSMEVKLAP